MRLFNFGNKKLDVDEVSAPRSERFATVREQAWKVFQKHDDELGFKKSDYKDLRMSVGESRGQDGHYTVKLFKGKEVVGEMQVEKDSGDYKLRDDGKTLVQTKDFGKDHSKEQKKGREDNSKGFDKAGRDGDDSNGYRLVRNCKHLGEMNGKSYEKGTIDIVDPKGKVVFSGEYNAGGFGNGRPPLTEHAQLATTEIKNTTLIGGKVTVPALRISDSSMPGRSGILIHADVGGPGTYGCLCFTNGRDMSKFTSAWNSIPRDERPRTLDAQASGSVMASLKEAKKLMQTGDMQLSDARSGGSVPYSGSSKQRQI